MSGKSHCSAKSDPIDRRRQHTVTYSGSPCHFPECDLLANSSSTARGGRLRSSVGSVQTPQTSGDGLGSRSAYPAYFRASLQTSRGGLSGQHSTSGGRITAEAAFGVSLSLDSKHHPAIYWTKSMQWEHSSQRESCVYSQNGQPLWKPQMSFREECSHRVYFSL